PTTLLEYLELARRARLVVAADTGPLHLACAAGAPVVGIFGASAPARNGPWSAADIPVRRRPLCSPCHRRRCPVHEGVMHAIPPEEVLKAIDRRLGARAPIGVAVWAPRPPGLGGGRDRHRARAATSVVARGWARPRA